MGLFRPSFDASPYTRTGSHLTELAFPLGGIGTGCVSLDGRGGLKDWEIFGRPNKGSWLNYTFPALWVLEDGGEPKAVTVQGPRLRDWAGEVTDFWSYGHGRFFRQMDGLPGFEAVRFTGTFPVARLEFEKAGFPLQVELSALNPFIPQDVRSSSFPAASLTYKLTNRGDKTVEACLAWSIENPVGYGEADAKKDQAVNEAFGENGLTGIRFTNARYEEGDVRGGEVVLATDWSDVETLDRWSEEGWWDSVRAFWNRFRQDGGLAQHDGKPSGARMPGTVACRVRLAPGESAEIPFVISWRFPTAKKTLADEGPTWTAHYATEWPSATAAAAELLSRRQELTDRTLAFEEALYGGSLGAEVLESVGATLSTLHSPTLIRIEDGSFWAWEGCSPQEGCCDGTCSHVWNYALAHVYLFPEIQRSFLDSAFANGFNCGPLGKEGAMRFRIPLPMAQETPLWHAASDGQLGQIVQAYREWRLTGDEEWLRRTWPALKQAMAFAWVQWDRDQDGLVDGDMHNTYDINFEGPNPLTQFFYLAALRAMAVMADHLADPVAARYSELEKAGAKLTMERLWNGEFFIQLGDFTAPESPRYQHGPGCLSDQLFGQLSAGIAGLGHLVDSQMVRAALASMYRLNFRAPLGEHENLQRIYAFGDEAGLLLCTWPEGGMPFYPFVYSDEVWTGIEYQVATHLALEGMEDEARAILKGIRQRYDGVRRNPWNEFECGSHYARALASYGMILALTGMRYDAVDGVLAFRQEPFRSFWSVPGAWGVAERHPDGRLDVRVIEGHLPSPFAS
ncbi:GH116 family glycosyl-hydrolase [Fimbriimonas ginsengisoli]|uniref:Glucosylceramidase n=1 Tax=Fimbriimonas ginsengisoli Gsoil 348 TaxID=661478 RepID=A0A068NQ61_FIMGI|nr:GH116 family glycosyl-hydrolase [Fimbriimonas ginsengisoli]AIE83749.1 hypothetical protein OP10G_0381 [Fimbriimonas ginsengisoli Gsoil 348]